jgi:hypothetical protein
MNSLQPPLSGPHELDRSPNELDRLMHAFFRAEMPQSWPVLKPPAPAPVRKATAPAASRSLFRSRFALAACLLILLIGQSFLSPKFLGSVHTTAEGGRGKIEARRRPIKSHESRPASSLKKAEAAGPSGNDGILISGRH